MGTSQKSIRPSAARRPPITGTIVIALVLTAFAAGFAHAGSEHGFGQAAGSCAKVWRLPDTGQTVHYSTVSGDDSDYNPSAIQPSYKDNGNNTITDNVTGLMWKKCSEGQNNDASCSGTAQTYTWNQALQQCNLIPLGYNDWRVPDIKELMSIMDYGKAIPPMINLIFPNTQTTIDYWSSTYDTSSNNVWCLTFNKGIVEGCYFSSNSYLRCIRGGR